MSRWLSLLFLLAWLAAPAASQAQVPAPSAAVQQALVDLAGDDADKREAAVGVLGNTGDPRWLTFLGALREGNVYARRRDATVELVVGGAKTTQGDKDAMEIQ